MNLSFPVVYLLTMSEEVVKSLILLSRYKSKKMAKKMCWNEIKIWGNIYGRSCCKSKQSKKNSTKMLRQSMMSLSCQKERNCCYLGSKWCRKTTTLEILEGLRKRDDGEIYYFGEKVDQIDSNIKEKIGVQLQSTVFFPKFNSSRNT